MVVGIIGRALMVSWQILQMYERGSNPSENTATLQHLNTPLKKERKKQRKKGGIYTPTGLYISPHNKF